MEAPVLARRARRSALAMAALALLTAGAVQAAEPDRAAIQAQIAQRHDAAVKALQDWIALPSIAAEDRNAKQGAEYMAKLAREAGFKRVEIVETSGKPGV